MLKQLLVQPFPRKESSICTYTAGRKVHRVTGTTHMGESKGTNLKPIPTILFFLASLLKSGSSSTPSRQLAWQAAEY